MLEVVLHMFVLVDKFVLHIEVLGCLDLHKSVVPHIEALEVGILGPHIPVLGRKVLQVVPNV